MQRGLVYENEKLRPQSNYCACGKCSNELHYLDCILPFLKNIPE